MDELSSTRRERRAGIAFGIATHALFGVTVWYLFHFLNGGHRMGRSGALGIDVLLALQFAVPHSLLLHPRGRKLLGRWIPQAFYGCFFCLMTCLSLLLLFAFWRGHAFVFWNLSGWFRDVIWLAFLSSWAAMFYSMSVIGLGYQTGWTPWWHWVRRKPLPKREFSPRGIYRVIRHPIYLSFLGLLWFTPTMTADRAVLTIIWTLYIFLGSYLKDERLAYYIGQLYRDYQRQVPAYPFFPLKQPKENEPQLMPIRPPHLPADRRSSTVSRKVA